MADKIREDELALLAGPQFEVKDNLYPTTPTPASTSDDTTIANTEWVRDRLGEIGKSKYKVLTPNGPLDINDLQTASSYRSFMMNVSKDADNETIIFANRTTMLCNGGTITLKESFTYQPPFGLPPQTVHGTLTTFGDSDIYDLKLIPDDYYNNNPGITLATISAVDSGYTGIPTPAISTRFHNCIIGYTLRSGSYALYNTTIKNVDGGFGQVTLFMYGTSRITGTITGNVKVFYMDRPTKFIGTSSAKQWVIKFQTYYKDGSHYKWLGVDSELTTLDPGNANWELIAGGSTTVTPTPVTLTSIAINGVSSINEGSSATYTVVGTYSDNSTQTITNGITWSSNAPNGVVTIPTNSVVGDSTTLTITATVSSKNATKVINIVDTTTPPPTETLEILDVQGSDDIEITGASAG